MPVEPLERIAIDIAGPLLETNKGNTCIMVVTDYFTKWMEAYALPNQVAKMCATKLIEEFICRFGVPRYLHSDQGRNFESLLFKEMCEIWEINKTRTSPLHPQSDSLVERFNRTVKESLKKCVLDNSENWDIYLPYILSAYRSSCHS